MYFIVYNIFELQYSVQAVTNDTKNAQANLPNRVAKDGVMVCNVIIIMIISSLDLYFLFNKFDRPCQF